MNLETLIGRVSPSRLDTAQRCLAQFFFRYVLRRPEQWSSALLLGRALDHTHNGTYADKMQTGVTPSAADAQARFAAEWDYEADGVHVWSKGHTREKLLDAGTRGIAIWRNRIATHLQPTSTQRHLERAVTDPRTGDQFELQGYLDVVGFVPSRGSEELVADLKWSSRAWKAGDFDRKSQPAAYTLMAERSTFQFHVIELERDTRVRVLSAKVTDNARAAFLVRAGMIRRHIAHAWRTGDWIPNRTHFLCTRRHCDFWSECERRFGGKVPA